LVTIECRKRRPKEDVTWIEQLATKKISIGAARTIAVSSSGFTAGAEAVARQHGIDLRRISEVSVAEINQLMRLDFVLFPHKRCAIARVGIRSFRSLEWTMLTPDQVDFVLPSDTSPHDLVFRNTDTGAEWSLNDLWLQLQQATDPYADIISGARPVIRTACFPYPGNVTVVTPGRLVTIGDVLLSVWLSIEVEQVDLASATKIEYSSREGDTIQRMEFASREPGLEDWRVSLQMPKNARGIEQLRTHLNQPNCGRAK
jgi:hypothetical protein